MLLLRVPLDDLQAGRDCRQGRPQIMHHHVHQAVAQALQAPQCLVTFLKLAALAPKLQVGGHPGFHLRHVKRFGDVVHTPDGKCPHLVGRLVVSADEDHRGVSQFGISL